MTTAFSEIFGEQGLETIAPVAKLEAPDWFDEAAYLQAHPDVAEAVARAELRSGYDHYTSAGWKEKRNLYPTGKEPRGRLLLTRSSFGAETSVTTNIRASVEAMLVSTAGGILVIGWVDDAAAPLDSVRLCTTGWNYTFDGASVVRYRRPDVEAALGTTRTHAYGFIAFAFLDTAIAASGGCDVTLVTKAGGTAMCPVASRAVADIELRNAVLTYIAQSEFFGNHQVEVMRLLDTPIGNEILNHNLHITGGIVAGACVQRFGQPTRPVRGSIVVCLYGKPEYLFVQNALFTAGAGFEDYELIYVSNSPDMAERLLKEANAAYHIYGVPQTIVLLPGNAGFGAANNVAVQFARSDRILIVNPDVFPRDADWALKHTQAIANLPAEQTRLFGVPLYYDDGSLMHGGMYFEFDTGVSLDVGRVMERRMLRVEHYGKGAPAWADQFVRSRPIQAVTGAFISADRGWYEALGGFTESYVFGHYEDADLCLKSIRAGTAPWIHDIRLWHLEGKGSLRLPVHEGGSLVNRWLFTRTWTETVLDGLEGPEPTNPMMKAPEPRRVAGDSAPSAEARPEPPAGGGTESRPARVDPPDQNRRKFDRTAGRTGQRPGRKSAP